MKLGLLHLLTARWAPGTEHVLELDEHCLVRQRCSVVCLFPEANDVAVDRVEHEVLQGRDLLLADRLAGFGIALLLREDAH